MVNGLLEIFLELAKKIELSKSPDEPISNLQELRALLYAKFGDNIQLEDENGGERGGGAASDVIAI